MTSDSRPGLPGRASGLVWFAAYFLIALLGRWQVGALQEDYGAFEDEASHMVTSAMVRGYATSFSPAHPIAYVEDYYLHYPKVAAGQWPPVLHTYYAAWMIPFGVNRWTILLASAGIAALAASATRTLALRTLGAPIAAWLGIGLLTIPLVQELTAAPMTELLIGALGAWGVFQFGQYLRGGQARHAWWYGLITLVAVWTKGNGTGLIAVALLAPWLAGRPNRWLTSGTIGSGLLVGLGGGAWYMATMHFSQTTWAGQDRTLEEYARAAVFFYSSELWWVVGSVVGGLAMIGWASGWRSERRRDGTAAATAWLLGLSACHWFIRTGIEARHVASALPVVLVLAGQGAIWCAQHLGWSGRPQALWAGGAIAVGLACQSWAPAHSPHRGYRTAVDEVLQLPSGDAAPWLVASDALGEGLVVAEAVLHDPRHERLQVLRASKVLARDGWLGQGYRLLHRSEDDLLAFLQRIPVGYVFFDRALWRRQWYPHDSQLLRILQDPEGAFELVAEFPVTRDGIVYPRALEVYRLRGFEALPVHPLTLDEVLAREPSQR